jgi:pimeloyl-ACP methyl ester carboxylesterase
MGVSMGAPIAISLSLQNTIIGLVLLVPAAYSLEARTKTFGPEFSVEIRKGWDNSPEFKNLSQFEGKIYLAYGSHDEVVPREIYEKYGTLVSDKTNVFEFESIGHKFMRETDSLSENVRSDLVSRLPAFILR